MAGLTSREISSAIRARRLERALSQAQLAELANVSRHFIIRLEHGQDGASLDVVLRILATLGLELTFADAHATSVHRDATDEADLDALLRAHAK